MSTAAWADLLTLREDPGRISAVVESALVFRFVPGTLVQENWAVRELQGMRTRQRQRHGGIELMSIDPGARVFSDNWSSDDMSSGQDGSDLDLQLRLDGAEDGDSWLFGADSEFGAAISETGLGMDGLTNELPPLAVQGGALFAALNRGALSLALMMRRIFGLDQKFSSRDLGDQVDSSKLSKDDAQKKRTKGKNGPSESVDKSEEPEDSITMRQVVRSAVKICLGLLLGVLLFVAVRRS